MTARYPGPVVAAGAPANQQPDRPTGVSSSGSNVALTPTLISSAYSDSNEGDIHCASQWQVSTASDFASFVWDSGQTATDKTSITIPANRLNYGTNYYWRVRYEDSSGAANSWSEWSAPVSFTTVRALPDLVVTSVALNATQANPGETLGFSYTVANIGAESANDTDTFDVATYLSQDQILDDSDVELGWGYSVWTYPLTVGWSYTFGHSAPIPETVPDGDYYLIVLADARPGLPPNYYPGVEEAREDNNWTASPTTVRIRSVQAQVAVLGNGISIASGDTTASSEDGTDFGTVDFGRLVTRTYTIKNTGAALLSLTDSPAVMVNGSGDFSVALEPGTSIAAGESTTFQIRFCPSGAGVRTATVSIANNDADENPYTFAIQGAGPAWGFAFYDNFDDGDFTGWSAVDPVTGTPTAAPQVVASPEGYALRGIGSGYQQDPNLFALLTRDLPTDNLGELKIEMRAKAGPNRPNAAQVQLVTGSNYYTMADYAMDDWNLMDQADWHSWVNGVASQYSRAIGSLAGGWHDFAWVRDAQGRWSLSIDGQMRAANFWTDNQLGSFTKVAISLLRDQSEIEWIAISGNMLSPRVLAVPVYRFWSKTAAHHFYTISEREKAKLITNSPAAWAYEGIAFYAFPKGDQAGTVPMYRFWSPKDNLHLFTIDRAERDRILATYSSDTWTYEGIAFYVYPAASHPADTSAAYQFRSGRTNMHFFTMSTVERDYIRAHYPTTTWADENEAWYAFA